MRLLYVTHHRRYKARPRSFAMARVMARAGHEVTLLVTANERKRDLTLHFDKGVHIVEAPDLLWGRLRSGWDPYAALQRHRYLSQNRRPYDFVHCFETRPATIYPALHYSRQHGTALLTDWNDWWGRGGIIQELRPRWYRWLFGWLETYYEEAFRRRGCGLTVISAALKTRAQDLSVCSDSILHLPGGVFCDEFPVRPVLACREKMGLPITGPILGFSSLDSHLDMDILFDTLRLVKRKIRNVHVLITGHVSETMRARAAEYGILKQLIFTGLVPHAELSWYLGCADVFLLPFPDRVYNRGRWPNKLGEYMSLGRPTVTNDVGDVGQLFRENRVGLIAEWSAEDFARKILYLLQYPIIARQIGREARWVAVNKYEWSVLGKKLESFYYELLQHNISARQVEVCKQTS